MSYSFLAGLEYGAKVTEAPVDPDTLIVKDFGGATTMGGNSLDEHGQPRMREYQYKVGEVVVGYPNEYGAGRTIIGVEAEAPPEGYFWVLNNGYPMLWPVGKPLVMRGHSHLSEPKWLKIDGVRVR